jgi:hypothetical protein
LQHVERVPGFGDAADPADHSVLGHAADRLVEILVLLGRRGLLFVLLACLLLPVFRGVFSLIAQVHCRLFKFFFKIRQNKNLKIGFFLFFALETTQ